MDKAHVLAGLNAAFDRFLREWAKFGAHRYRGWPSATDPRTYGGPMFWSEGDCLYRLGLELEKEFPRQVHMEFKLSKLTVHGFDPAKGDRRLSVDLVVSDLSGFPRDAPDAFRRTRRTKRSDLKTVDASWLPYSWSTTTTSSRKGGAPWRCPGL